MSVAVAQEGEGRRLEASFVGPRMATMAEPVRPEMQDLSVKTWMEEGEQASWALWTNC